MQTIIRDEPLSIFEGMMRDKPERMVSGIASELIFGAKALSVANDALGYDPKLVQGFTSGQKLYGIAKSDLTAERLTNPSTGELNQAPYAAYQAESTVDIIRKGRIWVRSADAVDSVAKSVFVKNSSSQGTPASITDTTTYPVADQDSLSVIVSIAGYSDQTVTFNGTTTTAAQVASQINAQIMGGTAFVNGGGQVQLITDAVGSTITIAVSVGTSGLTFDTPVDGTGSLAIASMDAKGSFRATTAAGHTEFAAGSGLEWIDGKTVGGIYYGCLEINLV